MKIRKVAVGNAAEAFIEGNFTNGVNIISSDDEDMEFWGKCFATASFLSTQYTLGRSRFEICRVFSYFQDAR